MCEREMRKWGKWWQDVLGVLQQHRKLKRRRRQHVNKFSNYVTQQCLKKLSPFFSFLLYQIVVVLPFGLPDVAAMLHNPNPTRSRVESSLNARFIPI